MEHDGLPIFFFQAEDGIRDGHVTGVQTCALPIFNAGFHFGHSVALSGDGLTLAVGAIGEASAARGINGDQTNRQASASGAVYVFTQDGDNNWSQQAYVNTYTAPEAEACRLRSEEH